MLSKFLRPTFTKHFVWTMKGHNIQLCPLLIPKNFKRYSDWIPPNQYDVPIPKKLRIGYVLKEYWETIPLFITTVFAVSVVAMAIIWACRNKVDIVFTTHSRENISRTMDLRNPSVHKIVIINQRYSAWPEMQDVLDKMKSAEKRATVRAQSCSNP